jgi:DNA-binding PadR family transcriptional regulator
MVEGVVEAEIIRIVQARGPMSGQQLVDAVRAQVGGRADDRQIRQALNALLRDGVIRAVSDERIGI